MRYTLAVILMVVGVVVAGLGVLQKTIWAPEETITATAEINAEAPAVIVDPGMLNLYNPPATLTAQGEGDLTIAQAPIENVDAWIGQSSAVRVTGLTAGGGLTLKDKDGDKSLPDPQGADLWDAETQGSDTVSLDWDKDANRTGFLITGGGKPGAVKSVTITWPNNAETPWAIPLMVIGGVLIVVGLVITFINRNRAHKEAARRKARQDRRRKLAEYGTAFAIVPVLALAGCGPEELPKPEPSEAPSSPMAGITDSQASRILGSVAEVVAAADKDTDATKLKSRVTGPALDQRKAIYKVRKKAKKQALPPAIATDKIVVDFTAATDSWPRITSLITSAGDQTQLLVLSQENPREDYKLWSQTPLIPGTKLPEFPDARQGAQLLGPDANGYVATPEAVLKDYASALNKGEKSKEAKKFESDDYTTSVFANQKDQKKAAEEGKAKAEFSYKQGKELVAQATAGDAAIVTGTVTAKSTITPETDEGLTGTLTLQTPQKELVDEEETEKPVETTTTQMLTFLVPEDGKARLIGVVETLDGVALK